MDINTIKVLEHIQALIRRVGGRTMKVSELAQMPTCELVNMLMQNGVQYWVQHQRLRVYIEPNDSPQDESKPTDEVTEEKLLLKYVISSLQEIESGLQGPPNAGNSVAYNKVHRLRSTIEKVAQAEIERKDGLIEQIWVEHLENKFKEIFK